jgi:hypothetical protein
VRTLQRLQRKCSGYFAVWTPDSRRLARYTSVRLALVLYWHLLPFVAVVAVPFVATGQDGQEAAEAPRVLTTYQDLIDLLKRDSVKHETDNKKALVRIPTKREDLEGTMLIRWQAAEGVVQFIQTLPMDISEDRIPAMETAVLRLNHALAVPGFGLDHQNRKLYYRFVAPFMPRGGLQDKEVRLYFQLTLKQAAEFFAPLKQVAEGADPVATVDAIRRAAKQKDDD